MTFDNSKTIISIRIKLFVATVLFLLYIFLTYAADLIRYPVLGLGQTAWTAIFVVCYLVMLFMPMYMNYQFIYFSDDGSNIVIRYFNSGIFGGKKNSVEINKMSFSGYKSEKRFFGLIQSITLYQRLNQGVAKYPPIYISALTGKEKEKVINSLNSYAPMIKD
ncbi:MAG: hypothetical protein WCE64_14400 [Bacteroidales bacterium]